MLAIGPAIGLIVAMVVVAITRPFVRRLGLRNAVRRPREAMLVMLGCVLGTALIVGSTSVGTSFTASLQDQALTQLGPVDARVGYENADDWSNANARLAATPDSRIANATAVATLDVPMTSNTSQVAVPKAKLIEADYRRAGVLTAAPNTRVGIGPNAGTAFVSSKLAAQLHLRVNSVLTIHAQVPQRLRVAAISNVPLVTFQDNLVEAGTNLLVPPGTISALQKQDPIAIVPRYFTLVVANTPHTSAPPNAADVAILRTRLTNLLTPFNPSISMIRQERLQTATESGKAAGLFLTTIGAFGILAGILLLVNVLLMLAEERLPELGTMRAVGLSRGPLIGAFSLEGAIYALVGGALGGLCGIGLGRFMVWIASGATGAQDAVGVSALPIRFALDRLGVAQGMAGGFLVSTLVVIATSYRISRLDVIRALRSLPDPARRHRQTSAALLYAGIVIGPIVSYIGFTARASMPFLVGAPLAFGCLGALVARRGGIDRGLTAACGPNIVWAVVYTVFNRDPAAPPATLVMAGVLIVTSGVLFVNAQQGRIAGGLRRVRGGRATVTSRLGLANPLAHRVRMLLTVGPFALVVFTLTYTEGLSHLITSELTRLGPRIEGSYQVYANSSPVHPFDFGSMETSSIASMARTGTTVAGFTPNANALQRVWPVTSFDHHLADVAPPLLVSRPKQYNTDAALYRAVAKNPDLIIVPTDFLYSPNARLGGVTKDDPKGPPRIGDVFTMYDLATSSARDVTVAGVTYTDVVGAGSFYGRKGAEQFFGPSLRLTSAFIETRGDPTIVVDQLQRAGVDSGVQAFEVQATAKQFFSFVNRTVSLYRSDLGIGIVVGIAGIAVVLVRSVRERRRQIGTLRAMGFDAGQIGWSFLLEGAFVAAQGLAVGVGLGSVLVMALTRGTQIRDILGFKPAVTAPDISTFMLAAALFVAALLASAGPARAASRIPPAVALRLVD